MQRSSSFPTKRSTSRSRPWLRSSSWTSAGQKGSLFSASPTTTRHVSVDKKRRINKRKYKQMMASLSSPLCVQQLEFLVCQTIPALTGNHGGRRRFRGLTERQDSSELQLVCYWLLDLLAETCCRKLPGDVLAEIHSSIGMLYEDVEDHEAAARSFLLSVFILSQMQDVPPMTIATALYRLGSSYGRTGQHQLMKSTLKRAFALVAGEESEEQPVFDDASLSSSFTTESSFFMEIDFNSSQQSCLWTVDEEDAPTNLW